MPTPMVTALAAVCVLGGGGGGVSIAPKHQCCCAGESAKQVVGIQKSGKSVSKHGA